MVFLTLEDLAPFATIANAKAQAMIADATAMAKLAAPCLADEDLTPDQAEQVKAILRSVVLRWNEAGSGALQSESIGSYSYSVDTRSQRRSLFWPSEIEQLRSVCKGEERSGIFSVDTLGPSTIHADICALNFGAAYCSCGASLTVDEGPLYEVCE